MLTLVKRSQAMKREISRLGRRVRSVKPTDHIPATSMARVHRAPHLRRLLQPEGLSPTMKSAIGTGMVRSAACNGNDQPAPEAPPIPRGNADLALTHAWTDHARLSGVRHGAGVAEWQTQRT